MKVLISSRSFGNADSVAIKKLKEIGLQPIFNPYGRKPTEDEIIKLIDEKVVGIIAGTEKITSKVIESASSLKVISRYGVGLDNVDLKYAEGKGIVVKCTPDAPTQAVAELALGLILNLLRKINFMDKSIKSNNWNSLMGNLLNEKNVGIIGLGRIGKRLVELIEPFHVNILVCEPTPDMKFVKKHHIKLVTFSELISESDIISFHCPISNETRKMIGRNEISKMKKSVLIINTSRGGLIEEEALVEALENKKIGGVAIDAFEKEPYSGKLIAFDNVILTPHIGSLTKETREKMELEAVDNTINALREVKAI